MTVRLEGLGQLRNCNDLVRNETSDLPASNVRPEPITSAACPKWNGILWYRELTLRRMRILDHIL
jgi:hypothetical protein